MEIYIEEKDKLDASAAANAFAQRDTCNRAYINTLGAELALKYLASENINVSDVQNIHSIKKILEEIDISDIILPNIHMDVRVVFDENAIFIPKSHFDYNLTPDIYLVFKPSKDFSYSEFLGFFEPKLINKNNANKDYYFIEKEKLSSSFDLKNYIENHKGNTRQKLSDEEMVNCERIIIAMADNDVTEAEKKYLIQQLTKCAELREKFIEYENFETLSYKAMTDNTITRKEIVEDTVVEDQISPVEEIDETLISSEMDINPDNITDEVIADGIAAGIDSLATDLIENNPSEELFNMTDAVLDDNAASELSDTSIVEESDMESVSLDNVEPQEFVEENVFEDTTISLENFEQQEITPETDFNEEEPVSFDNIEPLPVEEDIFEKPLEDMSDINIDNVETTSTVDNTEEEMVNIEPLSLNEEESSGNLDDDFGSNSFEDELIDAEILPDENNLEEISDSSVINEEETTQFDSLDEVLEQPAAEDSIKEDLPQESNESFGNNLMENLQSDKLDNVSVENFDINSDEFNMDDIEVDENSENISSSDLLSEIDNILNTSADAPQDNIEQDSKPAESYDDIPDISDLTQEDIITESPVETETFKAEEESEGFNMDDMMEESGSQDELGVLYDEEQEQPEFPQEDEEEEHTVPGAALYNKSSGSSKKSLIIAAALIAVLAGGAFALFRDKGGGEDIAEIAPNTSTGNPANENILTVNTPDIVNTEEVKEVKQPAKELKNNIPAPNQTPRTYMDVNRIVWDVPDSISYSKNMQSYLRTAGKSIKLSLSADLLLATEFAYTNNVKIGLKLSNNGAIEESKILSSSGSTQIDNIVLQSVKETLNVIKPPANEVKGQNFNLNLIIYF